MAEIAIKWVNEGTSPSYEIGDIILVQEDDSDWGTAFDPRINPNSGFVIMQITGLSIETFNAYRQALYDWTDPENPVMLKKRQFKIDKDSKMPQNIINYINNNNGFVTITEAQWNSFITNKEGTI